MEKLYYTIKEVSQLIEENASTLRYWEKEFDELSPKMTKGGVRQYTNADIELLKRIQYLLRTQELTIEGARKRLKVKNTDIDIKIKLTEKLEKLRAELMAIRLEVNANETTSEDVII